MKDNLAHSSPLGDACSPGAHLQSWLLGSGQLSETVKLKGLESGRPNGLMSVKCLTRGGAEAGLKETAGHALQSTHRTHSSLMWLLPLKLTGYRTKLSLGVKNNLRTPKSCRGSQLQWCLPIPAPQEAEAGGSLESKSSRGAWPTGRGCLNK